MSIFRAFSRLFGSRQGSMKFASVLYSKIKITPVDLAGLPPSVPTFRPSLCAYCTSLPPSATTSLPPSLRAYLPSLPRRLPTSLPPCLPSIPPSTPTYLPPSVPTLRSSLCTSLLCLPSVPPSCTYLPSLPLRFPSLCAYLSFPPCLPSLPPSAPTIVG